MTRSALVHEWFSVHGGSENVAEAIAEVLGDPDVYCLWRDDPARLAQYRLHESVLSRISVLRSRKALALPWMPSTWRAFGLADYDRLVVSSHLFAHHVGSAPGVDQTNVYVYVHSPARYFWEPELDQRSNAFVTKLAAPHFKRLDVSRVPRQASFASNSEFVRKRVMRVWGVDSLVIPPPVDVRIITDGSPWADRVSPREALTLAALPQNYVLGASRLVPYKRLEASITVGQDLGMPVVLAGGGPDKARLQKIAGASSVPVTFIDSPTTPLLRALFERADLYVFAAVEDFGIMPVESMALGTPVIVNHVGGARESVESVRGGCATIFDSKSERMAAASHAMGMNSRAIAESARRYDRAAFDRNVGTWLNIGNKVSQTQSSPES